MSRCGLCIKINDGFVLYIGELYIGEGELYYLYWCIFNVLIKYKNLVIKS